MLLGMLQLMLPLQSQAAAPLPVWSVDPLEPGGDMPIYGKSLFDSVTTTGGRQVIPFPFEKLLASFEAAAGCAKRPACTRAILLPLGRSLQRAAASPDFFAHPRVVAAVVEDGQGRLLRDRLYVGYQDKANVIEVISYNETLGRFEFQIVRNYQAGQTPQVSYARREICISCHQNHGPIFSRQVWLETNANPQIAARLAEYAPAFHGVAARGALDTANAIDDATDRANRLELVQKLWQEGCGGGIFGDRCRRGALIASLQLALTGNRAYGAADNFHRDVVDRLQASAKVSWPAGIAIPDADIVNRDPLAVPAYSDSIALLHVPARFDPLAPRAPAEIVAPDGNVLADELVRGIAGFTSAAQRVELDRALRQRKPEAFTRDIEASCEIDLADDRVAFNCGDRMNSLQMRGSIEGTAGVLGEIAVNGGSVVRHLQIRSIAHRSEAAYRSMSFETHDHGRSARLPDGNAISSIVLRWPASATQGTEARVTVRIRQDFDAVTALLDPVSEPVRTSTIDDFIAAVRREKRPEKAKFITVIAHPFGHGRIMVKPAPIFQPDCGNCHDTEDSTPPNFLSGDAQRISEALDSCAPRMFVRLAMQDVPTAQRDKTPMPPDPVLLPGERLPVRKSASIAAIRRDVEERLRNEYGRVPTVAELLKNGYENLRPCLPASG